MSKKIVMLLMIFVMCLSMTACGGGSGNGMSTDYMTIDAICVDDSYDKDGKCLVYMFCTVSTDGENLSIDSKSFELTVDGTNTYESERVDGACDLMPSYYFSDYLEDVDIGTSLKVAATFKIPAGDLEAGKNVTLANTQIPDTDKIKFTTDVITHYENQEAIAKEIDPDGYAAEIEARTPADAATVQKAQSLMNGYYWDFYVNSMTYKVEFFAPNSFEISCMGYVANSGTYSVDKGYIELYYPSNQNTVYVPYVFESGDISIEFADAFDINE